MPHRNKEAAQLKGGLVTGRPLAAGRNVLCCRALECV